MKFRIGATLNERMVTDLAEAARQCVNAGVLTAEEASVAIVEAVELEVIEDDER